MTADFLVEIGTEELPPRSLAELMHAFAAGLHDGLAKARLGHGDVRAFASPRRLAVHVAALAYTQPDRELELKGPPLSVAFNKDGSPGKAALAFAQKCGVAVEALAHVKTAKGEWLTHRASERGDAAAELLPELVQQALQALPVTRRMRWGANEVEFVRPVHWLVMLHGEQIVPGEVLGIASGRETRGHRVHAHGPLALDSPADYPRVLAEQGHVIADFAERRQRIVAGVAAAAGKVGGQPLSGDALYDEVCALTEWPVPMIGRFDREFLQLPPEVIVATLTGHQRYFPIANDAGELLPAFVTIANLDSLQPDTVRDGNERVIRPRLADAAFFWNKDRQQPLAERRQALQQVIYQRGLGSLYEKSERLCALGERIAGGSGADPQAVRRAAELAKCDLLTGMVGEFPELQGVMGRYYAEADGEPAAVAAALGEQYRPRFAGDEIAAGDTGRVLAIADKLDTLCGVFALGQKPSGNRDPFGLRRAALGIVRTVLEGQFDLDLHALIDAGLELQPVQAESRPHDEVYDFIIERMRGLCLERAEVSSEMFDAVRSRGLGSLLDIDARLRAVVTFVGHDAADSLAAANKRIANILRQAGYDAEDEPDSALFDTAAERELYGSMTAAGSDVASLLDERRYTDVLLRLAELRQPVDAFFDDVMVMADDAAVRANRLALLARLRAQFLNVADLSRLSIGGG